MYSTPSKSRRHVVLDIETVSTDPTDPNGSLSALTGRIVCVSLLIDDGDTIEEVSIYDQKEAALLLRFWKTIQSNDIFIGHNLLDFDLPFLRQRSWVHDIIPSRHIDLRRFYSHHVVDTMQLWSNWGATKKPSLDGLAQALGLRQKTAKGTAVADWWATGDIESIANYCREDVRITFQAFLRLSSQTVPDRS